MHFNYLQKITNFVVGKLNIIPLQIRIKLTGADETVANTTVL